MEEKLLGEPFNDPLADAVRDALIYWDSGNRPLSNLRIETMRSALHAHVAREAAVARLVEAATAIVGDPPGRMSVFVANYGRLVDALADYRASSPTSPVDPKASPETGGT